MERLLLDPADPLASVLRWIEALVRALRISPLTLKRRAPLSRSGASVLRRWLATWSRQLRAVIAKQATPLAMVLAKTLRPPPRGTRRAAPSASSRSAAPRAPAFACRIVAGGPARRGSASRRASEPTQRWAWSDRIDPAEDAALLRRSRAVLAALRDPSAATARLARRLAQRLARADAARAARLRRQRFPHPPRALGAVIRPLALAPEPRPPDGAASVRPAERPAAPAAAAPALAHCSFAPPR